MGCPVLIGPSTFNFAEVTRLALAEGAARQVADADELHRTVATLLADPDARQRMGAAGRPSPNATGARQRAPWRIYWGVWGSGGLRDHARRTSPR